MATPGRLSFTVRRLLDLPEQDAQHLRKREPDLRAPRPGPCATWLESERCHYPSVLLAKEEDPTRFDFFCLDLCQHWFFPLQGDIFRSCEKRVKITGNINTIIRKATALWEDSGPAHPQTTAPSDTSRPRAAHTLHASETRGRRLVALMHYTWEALGRLSVCSLSGSSGL
ncbi:hypothetical protein CB1_001359002 [Camelus ferus]|nr:hypothetical protein CB1_001359002 [Camelus ferus]